MTTRPALAAAVAREWALAPPVTLHSITKGHSNTNLLAVDATGRRFVARSPKRRDDEDFVRELRVVELLRAAGSPYPPRLVRHRSGATRGIVRGRPWALFEHVPGASAKPIEAGERPPLSAMSALGRAVAMLHGTLDAIGHELRFASARTRIASVIEDARRWMRAPRTAPALGDLVLGARPWLPDVLTCCEASLAGWDETSIIHGDLRYANVLFDGNRVAGILDYEAVGRAPRDFEHAVMARNMLTTEREGPAAWEVWDEGLAAYVAGYAEVAPRAVAGDALGAVKRLIPIAALEELAFLAAQATRVPRRRRRLLFTIALTQLQRYSNPVTGAERVCLT